jgi:hypothetical protein
VNPYAMPNGVIYREGGPVKLVKSSTSGPTYAAPARRSSRSLGGSLPRGYRAACSFVIDGRPVAQGEILKRGDPVVPLVLVQSPQLLVAVPGRSA